MRRFISIVALALMLMVAFMAVPFLFRDEPPPRVVGPALPDLDYQEVAFANGDLDLAGLLFLPEGDGPSPAAVFIQGSGTSRRDNPWYLSIAAGLQDNGIAVLLPDKRGSEGSGGDWRGTSLEDLATDTEAAFDYLSGLDGIDPDRIGIVGLSQGGWIAPIVAARRPGAAFVVSISGAGVTAEDQLLFEEVNNIVGMGTYPFVARLIAPITVRGIQQSDTWRAFAGYDPMPWWQKADAPVFVAFGGGDTNVPVESSVRRFEALSRVPLIRVYPDGGHAISDPATGRVQQALLNDLVAFLHRSLRWPLTRNSDG